MISIAKLKRLKELSALLLFVCIPIQIAAKDNYEVLSTGPSSVTFALNVDEWHVERVDVQGTEMMSLDFNGAQFSDNPGSPRLPHHAVLLGVPVGASVSARMVEANRELLTDVAVQPVATFEAVKGEPRPVLKLNQGIYQSTQSLPQQPIRISNLRWLRDQQIVRLEVAAATYSPQQRRLEKLKKIVLQVTFRSGAASLGNRQPHQPAPDEAWYRSALLNYEQARAWRKGHNANRALAKRSAQESLFYKFSVEEEGIYRIDGRFLESNISGLNLSSIDPDRIRLYNNGGREVARSLLSTRPDGLVENAIYVSTGGDGRFDRDDFILFFGQGVEGWEYDDDSQQFTHYINHYGTENVYWLTLEGAQPGKRMEDVQSGSSQAQVVERYQGMYYLEDENINPIRSGLNWFSREFASNSSFSRAYSWSEELPNVIAGEMADFRFRFVALNQSSHSFRVQVNGDTLGGSTFTGNRLSFGEYFNLKVNDFARQDNSLVTGENNFQIEYSHLTNTGQAYLDWVEIFFPARMRAIDNELAFTVRPSSATETFRVSGFSENAVSVFNVTEFADVQRVVGAEIRDGLITFTQNALGDVERYMATANSRYKSISGLERVSLTDLRSPSLAAQFIIITHPDFESEAQRLESYRENGSPNNRMSTVTVRITDIYNNFSAGMLDPLAIRDFLKYAYENWNPRPQYVLLLGDGDYDHQNRIVRSDLNWIPTFQSDQVGDSGQRDIAELDSRTTDSGFVYLTDDDYAQGFGSPIMDLAIGRLNVQTIAEAKNVVDKIIAYESQPLRGGWRNVITLVGDDELIGGGEPSGLDTQHIRQAEQIAERVLPRSFNLKKIYLSEYPKVISASSGGITKPLAKEALIRRLNQGTLIVNFIGHGNSIQWTDEHVFDKADNARVQNKDKLIFFVAATCDWALFDDPQRQSQAEDLLLFQDRGAIGMVSSARLVFSSTNFAFNQNYYNKLFSTSGPTSRIGDAFVQARIVNSSRINDEKYHIYGDPTLRLAVPELRAEITSLNPDSILALSTMSVEGEITNTEGSRQVDFNGSALVTMFDSRKKVVNVPEAGGTQTYLLPGNSLFRGTVPVTEGKFRAQFIVPKDISYGGQLARVSTYFWKEDGAVDGIAFRDDIKVSSASSSLIDNEGPEIKISFREHANFTTGDILPENVTLVVELADTVSGVNIAGEIGHRITLSIDPNEESCLSELNRFNGINTIDLTDLFQFDEGEYLRGRIEFPIQFPQEVEVGGRTLSCAPFGGEQMHTLVLKAWDNANNSSTASAEVRIVHEDGLVLRDVMNYPNPFAQKTTFTFFTNQDSEVLIKIFTVSGQLIKTVEYPNAVNGFNMIEWDGRDEQGDIPANGVYLYKLIANAQGANGPLQSETIGRMAIIR